MGKQSFSDPIVLGSSIALLQERFKQLQQVRKTREERLQCEEQPKWPCFPVAHSSHCHGPGSGRMASPAVVLNTSIYMGLWPHESYDQSSELRTEVDVDTSFHL